MIQRNLVILICYHQFQPGHLGHLALPWVSQLLAVKEPLGAVPDALLLLIHSMAIVQDASQVFLYRDPDRFQAASSHVSGSCLANKGRRDGGPKPAACPKPSKQRFRRRDQLRWKAKVTEQLEDIRYTFVPSTEGKATYHPRSLYANESSGVSTHLQMRLRHDKRFQT